MLDKNDIFERMMQVEITTTCIQKAFELEGIQDEELFRQFNLLLVYTLSTFNSKGLHPQQFISVIAFSIEVLMNLVRDETTSHYFIPALNCFDDFIEKQIEKDMPKILEHLSGIVDSLEKGEM